MSSAGQVQLFGTPGAGGVPHGGMSSAGQVQLFGTPSAGGVRPPCMGSNPQPGVKAPPNFKFGAHAQDQLAWACWSCESWAMAARSYDVGGSRPVPCEGNTDWC